MRVTNSKPKPWTREELREFIEIYPYTDTEVLMQKFGRSQGAILCKAHRLVLSKTTEYNIRRGRETQERLVNKKSFVRKWTEEDTAQFLAEYPDTDNSVLAEKYGRTMRAINAFAQSCGAVKSEEYKRQAARNKSKLAAEARWGLRRNNNKEQTNDR